MLKNYLYEMFALAQANDKDALTGIDLLVHNLENPEGPIFYEGAPDLDYPAMASAWETLEPKDKTDAKNEARTAIMEHYDALTAAWREQDRHAFEAALAEMGSNRV